MFFAHSHTLIMHSDKLLSAMAEHMFNSAVVHWDDRSILSDFQGLQELTRTIAAESVAGLLLEGIAHANARTFAKPMASKLPNIEDVYNGDAGSGQMFLNSELFEMRCRTVSMTPLIEGAINWYRHSFLEEMYEILGRESFDNDCYCGIYMTRDILIAQLLSGVVKMPFLEPLDATCRGVRNSLDEVKSLGYLKEPGFLFQGGAFILPYSAPMMILDPDDVREPEEGLVEWWGLTDESLEKLKTI